MSGVVTMADREVCAACGASSWTGVNEAGLCWGCEDAPEPNRAAVLRAMGVPMRLAIEEFRDPSPWPAGLETWNGVPWSVTLRGPVGTGKSMLAAELLWRRGRGLWVRAASLVSAVYGAEREERLKLVRGYENCGCLVIDDFGHGHGGGATETVAEVIAARYDAARPTIVTTNCRASELAGADAAAFDRLRDGLMVALMGESRRGA